MWFKRTINHLWNTPLVILGIRSPTHIYNFNVIFIVIVSRRTRFPPCIIFRNYRGLVIHECRIHICVISIHALYTCVESRLMNYVFVYNNLIDFDLTWGFLNNCCIYEQFPCKVIYFLNNLHIYSAYLRKKWISMASHNNLCVARKNNGHQMRNNYYWTIFSASRHKRSNDHRHYQHPRSLQFRMFHLNDILPVIHSP